MIQLDETDIKVSCLNIPDNQLPVGLLTFIRQLVEPSYKDPDTDLEEDMYSIDSLQDEISDDTWAENIQELTDLLNKHECGYFRIIKTKPYVQRPEDQSS